MSKNEIKKGKTTIDISKIKKESGKKYVKVGIIGEGKHKDSDYTVAEIGMVHEYGTDKIPERSFMRSTLHDKRKDILKLQKSLLKKILKGETTIDKALGLIGSFVSSEFSKKIIAIKSPPNKPSTIARKKSANPLVDSGQLANSMSWEIDE